MKTSIATRRGMSLLLSVILALSQYVFVVSASESEEPAATSGTTEPTATDGTTATPGAMGDVGEAVDPEQDEIEQPVIRTTTPAAGESQIPGEYAGRSIMNFAASSGNNPAKLVADNHAVMLRSDGRFMVWGDNTYGQLGLGAGAPAKVYVPTENTFFNDNGLTVKDVVVVEDATLVLCRNGELYTCGKGLNGRLGLGTTSNTSTPTLVTGSQNMRIQKLYPGKEFVVAHTDDNKLYAWGRNGKGQIGNGAKTDILTPTKIMDNADVQYLTVGDDYALLVKQDNSVWAWGNNESGQIPFESHYIVQDFTTTRTTSNVESSSFYSTGINDPPYDGRLNQTTMIWSSQSGHRELRIL